MDKISGVIRAVLAAGAGYLVGKGYFDQAQADQIVSAVLFLGTTVWSIGSKKAAKAAV